MNGPKKDSVEAQESPGTCQGDDGNGFREATA